MTGSAGLAAPGRDSRTTPALPPPLRTERLLLEPYVPGDEEDFVALFQADGHEIVYALAPAARGSGLGTEVAEALVAHGITALDLAEVHATVDTANTAALTLLERIGFAHMRDVAEDDGGTTRVLTRRRPG